MSQSALALNGWSYDPFWGLVSSCGRYAIRPITIGGRCSHILWLMGSQTKLNIPKCLGTFETAEKALKAVI